MPEVFDLAEELLGEIRRLRTGWLVAKPNLKWW
jgi:hypothetical protein